MSEASEDPASEAAQATDVQPEVRSAAKRQHQNANLYQFWRFSGNAKGYWNVDQTLFVRRKAKASYWALHWQWAGSSSGGYMGLQTDGHRFDGSTGDTAIFSLWNATDAKGPSCGRFGGEGSGMSCRLHFPIHTDRAYRLRVWRLSSDGAGQWWGAWIKDEQTGQDVHIGNLRVATSHKLLSTPRNFSEYFGSAVGCNQVPVSVVDWISPTTNHGNRRATYGESHRGECTGGRVQRFPAYGLARITQGGPR